MKAYLTRRYRFSASHRLNSEAMNPEENRRIYGKCNNPHGHGHNYVLEVTVSGQPAPATGMICDLGELDGFVERELLEHFGHSNLNVLPEFAGIVPTTENLCIELYRRLKSGFRPAAVERIRVEETMLNSFEYAGGEELGTR